MNNKEFEKKLGDILPFKNEVVAHLNKEMLLVLEQELVNGNSIHISDFGAFDLKKKAERITKHPTTKNRILIPPKLSLIFSSAKVTKQANNQTGSNE
ncbi:MAG: HU family DNA-binding protein [Bacteroidales bacterium]